MAKKNLKRPRSNRQYKPVLMAYFEKNSVILGLIKGEINTNYLI